MRASLYAKHASMYMSSYRAFFMLPAAGVAKLGGVRVGASGCEWVRVGVSGCEWAEGERGGEGRG